MRDVRLVIIVTFALLVVACSREQEKVYLYSTGETKLKELVRGDQILHSSWYLPSGELFRSTTWQNGTGVGYYLDDQGRLEREIPYSDGLAQGIGIAFEYSQEQTTARFVRYEKGEEIVSQK